MDNQTPPDSGATASDDPAAARAPGFDKLGRPLRGKDPLSKANRVRLLKALQAAAAAGDAGAAAALVELSLASERDALFAEMLRALEGRCVMARRRKRDGAMRARVEPDMIVADQRSAMMARLIEKADAGCLASAALVILLRCDRQRQHELVAVADALDIGDGDDAE